MVRQAMRAVTMALMAGLVALADASADAPSAVPRVIDLHVDLPFAIHARRHSLGDARSPTSLERLVRGQVGMLILPLFVERAHELTPERAREAYRSTFAALEHALQSRDARAVISPPGVAESEHRVATLLSLEGADGFADRPDLIVPWIRRGLCFVGLVHVRTNALAGSSTDPDRSQRVGLTEQGRKLVEIVYRSGAVVDVAHTADAAVDDIVVMAKARSAPVVVTHTGMRALKAIDRNLDDARVRAIASTGGVIGIDIHSGHIGSRSGTAATFDDVIAHIEHAERIAGIDHVAIGSDLDGGIVPPTDSDGAASWPFLARKLGERGWSDDRIRALFRGNAERIIAWARARGCASGVSPVVR